jgi:hypothetical protein
MREPLVIQYSHYFCFYCDWLARVPAYRPGAPQKEVDDLEIVRTTLRDDFPKLKAADYSVIEGLSENR